jgi:hypothetical protein
MTRRIAPCKLIAIRVTNIIALCKLTAIRVSAIDPEAGQS